MSLTSAQFERAAAAEASYWRLIRLQRMTGHELHTLLTGDPAEAAVWVRSAAEYGISAAQLRLGRMLLEGTGVPRDQSAALRWFERAADQGDAQAVNMLGRCHENGWGTAVNLQLAAVHYQSSAEAGHDWGQYNLGNLLFDGRGVVRNLQQALQWYLRAANQGHGRAMNLIGRCLEEGWGCPKHPVDAARWYRRSAESGYFRGQFNYALVLAEQGCGAMAVEWFSAAAHTGNADIERAIVNALAGARDPMLIQFRQQMVRT